MAVFPKELHSYGLNEELLQSVFHQVQTGSKPLQWQLKGVPNADFYINLHPFIKKWPITKSATKFAVGKSTLKLTETLQKKEVVLTTCTNL